MRPFFSIIVPIYNVERFLKGCLDSLIHQTFENIEIILINDGSTDGSGDIARSYASQDARIILHEQPNKGLSEARNAGLRIAMGDYIMFVDSDDEIELEACARLYEILQDKTIEVCKILWSREASSTEKAYKVEPDPITTNPISGREFFTQVPYLPISGCAWLYITKREFLTAHDITFVPNIFYEDVPFVAQILLHAKSIYLANLYLYHYAPCNDNSIMRGKMTKEKATKSFGSYLAIIDTLESFAKKEKDEAIRGALQKCMLSLLYFCVERLKDIKLKDLPTELQVRFKKRKSLLKDATIGEKIRCYYPRIFSILWHTRHYYRQAYSLLRRIARKIAIITGLKKVHAK